MRIAASVFLGMVVACGGTEPGPPSSSEGPPDTDGTAPVDTEGAAVDTAEPVDTAPPDDTAAPEPRIRWMLHGGGSEDDGIFEDFVDAAGGGHIVTLGAVPDPDDPDLEWWDGYFTGLGASSAVTVNTFTAADGDDAQLADLVRQADGVFLRGGDQSRYVDWWFGHALGDALEDAWAGGAVFGGSSAGCAVLGERIFDASLGTVQSHHVLTDAQDPYQTFSSAGAWGLPGVLTDTHFTERGRLVRLAVFLAQWVQSGGQPSWGLGVDPRTALFVRDDGTGFVRGEGSVTLLRPGPASPALPGGGPPDWRDLGLWQLPDGYGVDLDATDPVTTRPAWVGAAPTPTVLLSGWPEQGLDGSAGGQRTLGSHRVTGLGTAWSAWIDGQLGVAPGAGTVPGAVVMTRLFDDSDFFENHVGGWLWALASRPGTVGLGLDLFHTANLSGPATLTPAPDSAVVVIDGRTATHLGPAPAGGWQTASLEGATLHLVGQGSLDLAAAP